MVSATSPAPFCNYIIDDYSSEINKRNNYIQFSVFIQELLNNNDNVINEYLNYINTDDKYSNLPNNEQLRNYINSVNENYQYNEAVRMFCVYIWMHLFR